MRAPQNLLQILLKNKCKVIGEFPNRANCYLSGHIFTMKLQKNSFMTDLTVMKID